MWAQIVNINILSIAQLIFIFIYLVNHGLIVNRMIFLFLKDKSSNNNNNNNNNNNDNDSNSNNNNKSGNY